MKKTTTRLLATLLAALLLCGVLPLSTAAEGVDITAAFTDPAFRAAVQELVGKEVILDTDVAGVTELDVFGWDYDKESVGNIKSLAGLEYFISLTLLDCRYNQITTLPALPSGLKELYCVDNQLTSLPELPSSLIKLSCGSNRLASLPVLPLNLSELQCNGNFLTSLPALPTSLLRLYCYENQLSELPALPPGLLLLWCQDNQLTSIDVTDLQLERLDCRWNNMTSESDVIGFTGEWTRHTFIFNPQNTEPTHFWSTWPPFLQWLLEYVLFGWLWMRLF